MSKDSDSDPGWELAESSDDCPSFSEAECVRHGISTKAARPMRAVSSTEKFGQFLDLQESKIASRCKCHQQHLQFLIAVPATDIITIRNRSCVVFRVDITRLSEDVGRSVYR